MRNKMKVGMSSLIAKKINGCKIRKISWAESIKKTALILDLMQIGEGKMQGDLLCEGSQLSEGFSDSNIRRRKRTWNTHRSRMFNKIHSPLLDIAYQSVINLKCDRINYIPCTIFDYVTNTHFCFAHFRLLHLTYFQSCPQLSLSLGSTGISR